MSCVGKKYIILLAAVVLAIASLLSPASAHPGRTDSNGGHTDHATGEYHYHHGYPAHDHYDMDGDGRPDCPYHFEDKTNYGSSSNSNSSTPEDTTPHTTPNSGSTAYPNSTQRKQQEKRDLFDIVFSLGYFCCALFVTGLFVIAWLLKKKRKNLLDTCRWLAFAVRGVEGVSCIILMPYGIALMFLGAIIGFVAWIFYNLWMLASKLFTYLSHSDE